ncbi:MAG: glycosyltransferase family 4 protein [Candidatus Baldrarchaeia archaeon]
MNILVISLYFPPDMGGASNRAWNAALGLKGRGHRVKVIAGFPHYPDGNIPRRYQGKAVVKEYLNGLEVYRVWVPPLPTEGIIKRFLIYFSFMWSSLFAVFWVGRVDGIFYVSPFSSTFVVPGLFYRVVKGARLILDCGDLWPNSAVDLGFLRSGWLIKMAKFTSYVSYRLANGIAPINHSIKRGILREYKVHESKVHVVELGVDPEVFRPLPKNPNLLERHGLQNKFVVMYSGVLGPAYDFDTILKAAKILESDRNIVFVIRGDGERKQEIIDKMDKYKLSNVVLLGKVESTNEVVEYLNLADLFVLPMKNVEVSQTAIPSKVYEYLACGKPIICCAEGELNDFLCKYNAGLTVSTGDFEALSKAILSIYKDHVERIDLGDNARKAIVEHFSNQKVGQKLENIFHRAKQESANFRARTRARA